MRRMAKQDDWVRITLRIPPNLHYDLLQAAGANSLNAEIVTRLEATFKLSDLAHAVGGIENIESAARHMARLVEFAEAAEKQFGPGYGGLLLDTIDKYQAANDPEGS